MGIGCTPKELAVVSAMIHERIGPDWLILALPDGRFAALWAQGLEGEHGAGVARGDYCGCYAVGTLPEVRAAIVESEQDPKGDCMTTPSEQEANAAIEAALKALTKAAELAERVGYGSQVLGPLADAQRDTRYALDTVLGRT